MKQKTRIAITILATLAIGIVIGRTIAKPRLVLYSAELADAGAKTVIPHAEFDRVPLKKCTDRLGELSGASIHVRWEKLRNPGVDPDLPITMSIRNLPLDRVMDVLIEAIYDQESSFREYDVLAWYVDHDIIVLTADRSDLPTVCRMYDARNIIRHAMSSRTKIVAEAYANARTSTGHDGSEIRQIVFDPGFDDDDGPRFEELEDQITSMLIETVDPDTWRDAGGRVGSIRSISGLLIIEQTRSAHEKIAVRMKQLEEAIQQ